MIVDSNGRWSDITSSTTSDANYGGGMTLRIGRPEFTRFDQPGLRAWQLLDLFHTTNRVNSRGLININTASRDVLRALGAGVLLNRDPNLLDVNGNAMAALYPPFQSKQADLFADAVIAARPLLSTAQLAGIKTAGATPVPFFGNPDVWPSPSPQPSEWNDSGTEEYFAKVFPLTTVRSRNFRVFVTGQSLDRNGNVLATVSKVFQVFLQPNRDENSTSSTYGKINSQNVSITYEAQLPL
jgi:hypothetical protein